MEVFIRDVPQQASQGGLRDILQPYMKSLGITIYQVTKPAQKQFAFLIFLHAQDGHQFLAKYGQAKPSWSLSLSPADVKLRVMSTPIFCAVSNKPPNPLILQSLATEEKNQKKPKTKTSQVKATSETRRDFHTKSLSCGELAYSGSDLVFVPYTVVAELGIATFGSRSLSVRFDSGKRIDFQFSSINEITVEGAPSMSLTFKLWEPPRSYQGPDEPLSAMMSGLSIKGGATLGGIQQRKRVTALNSKHEIVVGTCLVYRILLSAKSESDSQVANRLDALQHTFGFPPISYRSVETCPPLKTYSAYLKDLDEELSRLANASEWRLSFQIRLLVTDRYLTIQQTLALLPEIGKLFLRSGITVSIMAIQKFRHQIPWPGFETEAIDLELPALVKLLLAAEVQARQDHNSSPELKQADMAMVHRIYVTPAGVYLYGPNAEPMNRVLRKYPKHHDYFLRVVFGEEDGEPVRYSPGISNDFIYNERFRDVLRKGISVAGRHFNFLGFSHSSLRSQACWFMAPFIDHGSLLYDRMLIKQLGDFSKIRCPAKCAARIGQAFSETPTAVAFPDGTVKSMIDVERNGRVFSDGVGTISRIAIRRIWNAVPSYGDSKPTCLQIRFRGAKGMLSLDSRLTGEVICLRPSMIKFDGSTSMDIELCSSSSKPLPMYLNRQVIKIFEDMGVDYEWFQALQSQEVARLRNITTTSARAANFLQSQLIGQHSYLPWFLKKLFSMGLEFRSDRFLRETLELAVMMQVRVIKYRARIPVPLGTTLYGIMDETDTLEEGQIFCVFDHNGKKSNLVWDRVVITRAPALHPGDVQTVDAVSVPKDSPLRYLCNCVVFSQRGDRDLPSKLSGGDLDGDLYNVIWDPGCSPQRCLPPADYPRVPAEDIRRTVERDDMTDFFVKFMETDQLGRIATAHQILADQKPSGTLDRDCTLLAELHSTAVDFSKTGVPVDMKKMPRYIPVRPDFMAPGPHMKIEKKEGLLLEHATSQANSVEDDPDFTPYRYYESNKILGKLFRAVDEHDIFADLHKYRTSFPTSVPLLDRVWNYVDRMCRSFDWHAYLDEAKSIRNTYEDNLLYSMKYYSDHPLRPISELEIIIGNILGAQAVQSHKQRDLSMTLKEAFDRDVASVVGWMTSSLDDKVGSSPHSTEALLRSVACFKVSLGEVQHVKLGGGRHEPLVSFRYLAAAVCLREIEALEVRTALKR